MVARSIDEPRTAAERIADASARLDDLSREQNRAVEALRTDAGGVMRLTGAADQPSLQPDNVDVSVRFRDAGIEIRDYVGGALRDLLLRDIVARGGLYGQTANVTGNVSIGGTLTGGQTNVGNVICAQLNIGADTFARDIHQEGFGLFTAGIKNTGRTTSAGFTDTTASDRALKRDVEPLGRSALDAVRAAPIQRWRYDPVAVADLHIPHGAPDDGPSVDLALHPELWHVGPMVDDLPDDAVLDGDYGKVPDLGGMGRYAWQAVRELADIVDAQAQRITAIEARLTELSTPSA